MVLWAATDLCVIIFLLALIAIFHSVSSFTVQPHTMKLHLSLFSPRQASLLRLYSSPSGYSEKSDLKLKLNGYIERINECNQPSRVDNLVPFDVGEKTIGFVKPEFCTHLQRFPGTFQLTSSHKLVLNAKYTTLKERSAAIADVTEKLASEGLISRWRNELYEVKDSFQGEPLFLIERAAVSCFGLKGWGVHINGYVENEQGEKKLWIAKRSPTKINYPGMLDNLVAGGQPSGVTAKENVIKECMEEASIPEALACKAHAVSTVSYSLMKSKGLVRDTLLCYDLKLPHDFVPSANDGEVESFSLLSLDEVAHLITNTTEIKPNCNLVMIDFLIRHGYITPDSQPDYENLVVKLRNPECS